MFYCTQVYTSLANPRKLLLMSSETVAQIINMKSGRSCIGEMVQILVYVSTIETVNKNCLLLNLPHIGISILMYSFDFGNKNYENIFSSNFEHWPISRPYRWIAK